MDYQKLYSKLFNGITDTIERLQELQIQVEEDYLQMREECNVVKFNVVKGKPEVPVLAVDDDEYEKLLATLYTDEWQEPAKGLLDAKAMEYIDATAVQYMGDAFDDVLLFISNKSNNGKHIISIMPVGEKGELSIDEHIAILENFENAHKDIKFNK